MIKLLARLTIAFSFATLLHAALFWLITALERNASLFSFGYLPIAAAFGAAIGIATMRGALAEHPFAPSRSLYQNQSAALGPAADWQV